MSYADNNQKYVVHIITYFSVFAIVFYADFKVIGNFQRKNKTGEIDFFAGLVIALIFLAMYVFNTP